MTEFMVQIRRGDDSFEITDDGSLYIVGTGSMQVDRDKALEALELLKKSVKGDKDE